VIFPNGNFIGQQSYERFIESEFNLSVQQFEQEVKVRLLSANCWLLLAGRLR